MDERLDRRQRHAEFGGQHRQAPAAQRRARLGTAKEMELMALLLRFYANAIEAAHDQATMPDDDVPEVTDEMLDRSDWYVPR
jgi:hypothetical protein